jgi:HlyD family secretion protein
VTSIAVLPASGTTGTTYPVTVALDGGTTIPDGSTATVSLLAGNDRGDAMVVPTSSVIARGRGYAVQVDNHGTLTTVPVTVGASGPIYTQITGGLTAGQEVVIANLTSPLPTGNTGVRGLVGAGTGGPGGGRTGGAGGGAGPGGG